FGSGMHEDQIVQTVIFARDFEWSERSIREAMDIAENSKGVGAGARQIILAGLAELPAFFADRLKVQQREAGVRHDLIDAVFALGNEDDLVRLLARVKALQNFIATEDGADLLA